MNEETATVKAYEVICRAVKCAFNRDGSCMAYTRKEPVIIAPGGGCAKYEPT